MTFQVGNRVKVYATLNGYLAESAGMVVRVETYRLQVVLDPPKKADVSSLDSSLPSRIIFAHPKQCRRLRVKMKQEKK